MPQLLPLLSLGATPNLSGEQQGAILSGEDGIGSGPGHRLEMACCIASGSLQPAAWGMEVPAGTCSWSYLGAGFRWENIDSC